MRGFRAAGAGLSVAVIGAGGLAGEPAARFGAPLSVVHARGQAPMPPPGGTPPAPGVIPPGGVLSQPRPLPQGPTVTEQRATPQAGTVAPPVTFGAPIPYGGPSSYLGVPPAGPVVGSPPAVGPVYPPGTVVTPNMEQPLVGGFGAATGPFGILTGGNGFNGAQRFKLDADFLLWFVKSGSRPPLVTTGNPDQFGFLGAPDTRVLAGGDTIGRTLHTGGRFSAVYWLDECNRWGLDGSLFFLARRGWNETYTTANNPLLARPFFNLNQNQQFSEVVARPGLANGSVTIQGDTQMWGADANVRRHLMGGCDYRVDGLLGFRYLNLGESLNITESYVRQPGAPMNFGTPDALAGTVTDRFRTENHFYGPQVGLTGEVRRGRWFAEARAAVAMGTVFQSLHVAGSQLVVFPTGPQQFEGGLLALPGGNLGSYTQRKFGVVPEAGFKLGCHLTDRWRVNVGYNFLYLNSVIRPGEQIDPGLDVTRIPNFPLGQPIAPLTQARPAPRMDTTGVFTQGISFGVQWAF